VKQRAFAVALGLAISSAAAGSVRHDAWSYGVDVGEEGESGAELWLGQNIGSLQGHALATQSFNLWTGLTTTLTDRLELAVYGVLTQEPEDRPLQLTRGEAQLRLKIFDWMGVVAAPVLDTAGDAFGGVALVTLQGKAGPLDVVANLGGGYGYDFAPASGGELDASGGASYPITSVLRVNLEAFLHTTPRTNTVVGYAGPGIELDKGHFWGILNAALGDDSGAVADCTRLVMGLTF
jgi:hypothetical protein